MKSRFLGLIFSMVMILLCTPAFAADLKTQSQEKVLKEMDMQKQFGDVDGCAVIYSQKYDVYYVYNPEMLKIREIPCSTFKIISALAGLENKVLQDEHTVRRWDGIKRDFPLWNQDLSLASAIQLSATWYFDEVTEEVGMDKVSAIVKEMQYGNMDASGGIQLWGTSLKISPFEQITFIEKEADEYYIAVRIYGDKDRKDIAGGTAQSITLKILDQYFAD